MDKYDFLEAMSGIRDEYIEDAAMLPQSVQTQEEEPRRPVGESSGKDHKGPKILHLQRWAATAAAVVCVCVIGFTMRSSQRVQSAGESDQAQPGMVSMSEEKVQVESEADPKVAEFQSSAEEGTGYTGGSGEAVTDSLADDGENDPVESMYVQEDEIADVSAASAMAASDVSEPIRQLTEEEVRVFENSLAEETGYSSLRFTYEITTDSDEWFSLKMRAYTCAADGFEQVTHFNVSRDGTRYVTLETLFSEETDYITPLSREVIRQMREQMAADPDKEYWLDSEEGPDYDFTEISPAQDFYFNSDGNLVLCFNEGEAAPLYMGTVEFTIPREITEKLLKS